MQALKQFAAGRWSNTSFSTHDQADPAPLERVEMPLDKPAEVIRDEFGAFLLASPMRLPLASCLTKRAAQACRTFTPRVSTTSSLCTATARPRTACGRWRACAA